MSLDPEENQVRQFRFGSLSAPVCFDGCDDLIEAIRSIFPSWSIQEVPERSGVRPAVRFRKKNGRFIWHSSHFPPPDDWEKRRRFLDVKNTAADFHYVFFDWYLSENTEVYQLDVQLNDCLIMIYLIKSRFRSRLYFFMRLYVEQQSSS